MFDNGQPRALNDRYLLLARLGSGGMGTVWRATDRLLNRTVAIKEMHLRAAGRQREEQAARAHREAHAIARISHPNVVNVYDLVSQDERVWLVMELVDGPSLKEYVASTGPMSPSAVAGIGLQLLAALEAVHAAGALHRDVKPGNVLLRRDGRVVLCDFGIAALAGADTLTTTGAVMGSFEFVAPERLTDQPAGPPSDLFSLGVTLCVLLSGGRSPFARPEGIAVLNAIIHEPPELPAAAGPLRHTLEAMLRKDPVTRPSAAVASAMLRPLATGTNDPSKGTHVLGTVRRGRRAGLTALSLAVLLAAGATAGVLVNRSSGVPAPNAAAVTSAQPSAGPASAAPLRIGEVMPVPGDPNLDDGDHYWMFSGDHYRRVYISASGYPVRQVMVSTSPLQLWDDTFAKLPAFRGGFDAVLSVPGSPHEYWVFSGDQYIRIRVASADRNYDDTLVAGPKPLSDWGDAFGALAADGIDAVMPTPDDPKQYWVFSGDQYVRTTLDGEGPTGRVMSGPKRLDEWPGTLGKVPAFSHGIDAVLPVPGERNDYWVFAGTQYMKIRVTDVEYTDTVLEGPEPLRAWSALS